MVSVDLDCARSANDSQGASGIGMEMPRYFCDLDDGKTNYVDSIGTELANIKWCRVTRLVFWRLFSKMHCPAQKTVFTS